VIYPYFCVFESIIVSLPSHPNLPDYSKLTTSVAANYKIWSSPEFYICDTEV